MLFHLSASVHGTALSTYVWKYVSLFICIFPYYKHKRFKGTGWQCDDVRTFHPNLLFQMLGGWNRWYITYVNNRISKRY